MLGCGTTELGIFVVLPKVGMHQIERRSLRNGPVDNLMETFNCFGEEHPHTISDGLLSHAF